MVVMRRYNFKLYPNATQMRELSEMCVLHGHLWNAVHEISETQFRRTGGPKNQKYPKSWRQLKDGGYVPLKWVTYRLRGEEEESGKRPSRFDLAKQLKDLRAQCPEYAAMGADTLGFTIKRYCQAWDAFFRKFNAGEKCRPPGYRRTSTYPGFDLRYSGKWPNQWGGSGCRFDWTKNKSHKLYVKGISGLVRARGRMPEDVVRLKTLTVTRDGDAFSLSVVVEKDIENRDQLACSSATVRLDLMRCLAEQPDGNLYVHSDGAVNDRPGQTYGEENADIAELQRRLARCVKYSNNWKRICSRIRSLSAKIASRRRHQMHERTTEMCRRYGNILVVDAPKNIKETTESGRGDSSDHGAMVAQKACLNRHVLHQAPSSFVDMLRYKTEESGGSFAVEAADEVSADVGRKLVSAEKARRKANKATRNRAKQRRAA